MDDITSLQEDQFIIITVEFIHNISIRGYFFEVRIENTIVDELLEFS